MAFCLQLYNGPLYSTVNIHAALRSGMPRWLPLSVAVAMPYWQDYSRRVSWQAATSTRGRQLRLALVFRLGEQLADGMAVAVFDGDGFLKFVIFVFAFFITSI